MDSSQNYVRARIDKHTKQQATHALQAMGLSVSDAIRLLMVRIAAEQRLPFDVKVPNTATQAAIQELGNKRTHRAFSVDELMDDLNAGD